MSRSAQLAPFLAFGATGLAVFFASASCVHSHSQNAPVIALATTPPQIPVGLDAYRLWDEWPTVRLGVRTRMTSTYDRAGANEASDASHFVREVAPGDDVSLDVAGTGYLYFFRANQWHGSPWNFVIDGQNNIVAETSTATPDAPVANSTFIPADVFPEPLAFTGTTSHGADVSWVPMGFSQSLAIHYGHSHYGTGYYVYSTYDPGAALSMPIAPFALANGAPDPTAFFVLQNAGSDIAPASGASGVRSDSGVVDVDASGATTLIDLPGPLTIRALRFVVPDAMVVAMESARIRVTWDNRASPSIDASIPLFFGTGSFFNRNQAEYLVKSVPAVVHDLDKAGGAGLELSMYFPMPFFETAHIELVSDGPALSGIAWELRSLANTAAPNAVGYLHATYKDHGTPTTGQDLVLLDTTQTEDGGDTCGNFVGTSFQFSDAGNLTTLEGDPRFFFDDSLTPQAQGTGTEEWGAGGDYWGGLVTTLPLAGHPVGAPSVADSQDPRDLVESAYRFLLADSFPFGKNARIQIEHGGVDDSLEHYRSVVFWYGTPGACLVQTDSLHVSDANDEAAHAYVSPDASAALTLTSRYDFGVDHVGTVDIDPATTDTGRSTTGTSEFSIALRPDNFGVILRRKLDSAFPDQRAQVFIANDANDAFSAAGTWYLAGGNTGVFVDSATETGEASAMKPATATLSCCVNVPDGLSVQTSNRRWRDDEFLIPRAFTQGRDHIRVRLVFTASGLPVAPGRALAPQAWSEYRYTAYSYVMPGGL